MDDNAVIVRFKDEITYYDEYLQFTADDDNGDLYLVTHASMTLDECRAGPCRFYAFRISGRQADIIEDDIASTGLKVQARIMWDYCISGGQWYRTEMQSYEVDSEPMVLMPCAVADFDGMTEWIAKYAAYTEEE